MQRLAMSGMCALALLATGSNEHEAPLPGPGGVYDAVQSFVDALDRGDVEYLKKALVTSRNGLDFIVKDDGELTTQGPDGAFDFWDEATDGTEIAADNFKDLAALLPRMGHGDRTVTTKSEIVSLYADCPSGECSYAVVEFDRVVGTEKKKRIKRMRATALVRHVGGKAPQFRVFHWHAGAR